MEKSEPTLVPEWLKGTGNVSGGGTSNQHSAQSLSHLDDHAPTPTTRTRSSASTGGDYDSPRSSGYSDRTSSSYFRRSSSSNGSMGYGKDSPSNSWVYSSFSRSHREKDLGKDLIGFNEKERSLLTDCRDRNYSDSLGISSNALSSRIEDPLLRRSQSMVSGNRGDVWPKKTVAFPSSNKSTSNGVSVGGKVLNNIHKATFERDFPSLGVEERGGSDIGRVPSPGLVSAVQSTMGTSSMLCDGWTSVLVNPPSTIVGSNNVHSSSRQTSPITSTSATSSITTGLNMAETLAQSPSRGSTAPQLSVEALRLEELALNRSRQLVPMKPSMPKALVLNSEKQKPKVGGRSGEMTMASKIGQQQLVLSHQLNPQVQGGLSRSDGKASHGGKLLVLKPAQEKNGIPSTTSKDGSSLISASRVTNNTSAIAPSAPQTSPKNSKLVSGPRKASPLPSVLAPPMEKTPSQVKSRNDFFNRMRMKASGNPSATPDSNPLTSPEKANELIKDAGTTSSPQGSDSPLADSDGLAILPEINKDIGRNENISEDSQGVSDNGDNENVSPDATVYPDEEEAKFLRSLGWDENEEGGGLTPEEINGFYQSVQCMKLRPALKLCGGAQQLKIQLLLNSHVGGASSRFNSRDSKSEA